MKKLICLVLVFAVCFGALTSCAETESTTTNTSETTRVYPVQISKENILAQGFFTGTVRYVLSSTSVSVYADDKYFSEFGETTTVSVSNSKNIKAGDKIRIRIENFTKGETVKATNFQIIETVDKRDVISEENMRKYDVTSIAKMIVPRKLKEAVEIPATELTELRSGWDQEICRIVKIEDDTVYLADIYAQSASAVIKRILEHSFAVGDFIFISCPRVYKIDNSYYYLANARDITEITVLTKTDIESILKRNHNNHYYPADKPVIYLYPEEETTVSVKVNINGELTCTYPKYGEDGWQNFTACPDGTLISPDGNEYYCLYWEGLAGMTPDFSKGFCVKGEDTAEFLAETLEKIGLTPREANEFIIYWLPILEKNEYNLISFQQEAYTDTAELEITPKPDSLLRVFMAAKPLDVPVEIEPQEFEGFERNGFTAVEWGGGIAK